MNKTQKVLYISWAIPPSSGGSAFITHQLAKLVDSSQMVIAGGSDKLFQSAREFDGVTYHYFFTELNWRGHGARFFSVFRWLLFPLFLINLSRLASKEKPKVILVTFPDGYYLLASWMVSRMLKLNLIPYFHNTYVENRNGLSKWFAQKIQHFVFKDSKLILLISEGLSGYYQMKYPMFAKKFHVLPHTFDRYPVRTNVLLTGKQVPPYKLVMIGTFNQSNMEATRRLFKLISQYRSKYVVDIYTSTSKQILKFKYDLDLDELGIRHMGFVDQNQVNDLFPNYDGCLLTHGFTGEYTEIEYQTIFPTRTIPLLLSGKPLLVHSPETSFLNAFIKKYDCAELVQDKTDQALLIALEKITTDQFRIQQILENAKKACDYFYGPHRITLLFEQINAVVQ